MSRYKVYAWILPAAILCALVLWAILTPQGREGRPVWVVVPLGTLGLSLAIQTRIAPEKFGGPKREADAADSSGDSV